MTAPAKIKQWMMEAASDADFDDPFTTAKLARIIAAHAPKQLDAEKLQRYISTDLGEVCLSDNVTELEAVNDELWQVIKTLTTNYESAHASKQEPGVPVSQLKMERDRFDGGVVWFVLDRIITKAEKEQAKVVT